MSDHVDPLRQLRPIPEEELAELASNNGGRQTGTVLAYDVYRSGDALVLEFDVPGVPAHDVHVAVEDRSLVVEVSRGLVQRNGVDVVVAGRQHGTFARRLFLGERWDLDGLRASIGNGVLTLRAPIAHQLGRRRVFVADDADATNRLARDDDLEGSFAATLSFSTPAA